MRQRRQRRPTGPSACLRSKRLTAFCDTCGVRPETVHSPLFVRGFYCPEHCVTCHPAQKPKASAAQGRLFEAKP